MFYQLNIEITISEQYEDETPEELMELRAQYEAEHLQDILEQEYPFASISVYTHKGEGESNMSIRVWRRGFGIDAGVTDKAERKIRLKREQVFYDSAEWLAQKLQQNALWFTTEAHTVLVKVEADWLNSEAGAMLAAMQPDEKVNCYVGGSITHCKSGIEIQPPQGKDYALEQFLAEADACGAELHTS